VNTFLLTPPEALTNNWLGDTPKILSNTIFLKYSDGTTIRIESISNGLAIPNNIFDVLSMVTTLSITI
jgi:hypothetical protein